MVAVIADQEGAETLVALEYTDRPTLPKEEHELCKAFASEFEDRRTPLHDKVEQQLAAYFAGELLEFTLPLQTPGTPFQQKVWRALLEIPFGQTCSYGQLAEQLGSPGAQRAVGAANGANRIAIVVPCHRVIESGGGLRGYGGGLERKQFLLELEGAWPTQPTLFSATETHPVPHSETTL